MEPLEGHFLVLRTAKAVAAFLLFHFLSHCSSFPACLAELEDYFPLLFMS